MSGTLLILPKADWSATKRTEAGVTLDDLISAVVKLQLCRRLLAVQLAVTTMIKVFVINTAIDCVGTLMCR